MMFLYFVGIILVFLLIRTVLRSIKISSFQSRYVFITGCDTGFGNMLAKRLDNSKFFVFAGCLTETGETDLVKNCSERLITVTLDVTKADSIQKAVETVKSKLPRDTGLWALVNNAGIGGTVSPAEWITREDYDKVLAVNLYGVVDVTRAFLPLIRRTPGRIINTASMCGRYTAATAPYNISKYGVEAFSDTIRKELYKTGVTVHILEPGFFSTGIVPLPQHIRRDFDRNFERVEEEVKKYYGTDFKEKSIESANDFLEKTTSKDAYKVIDAYIHAITYRFPKARYVIGRDANIAFRLLWNLPEWASDYIVTRYHPVPAGAVKR